MTPVLFSQRTVALASVAMMSTSLVMGCAATSATEGAETTTIRYQAGAGLLNHLELADALGYLDGLELDWVGSARGGPEMLQSLATDQVDIAVGPFHGATAKVVSTGVPLTVVVASYGSDEDTTSSIVTREDSSVSSGRDLIGKKVAVNTLGANAEAVIDTYLASEGLTEEEISQVALVPLPSLNHETALRQGQVDAAYMGTSSKELAKRHGGVQILADDVDFVGPYVGGSTVLTDEFIEENPTTTTTLVSGIARAIDFEQTHPRDEVLGIYGAWLDEQGRGEVIEALELWNGSGIPSRGGVLRDEYFTIWLDWLEASGEIDTEDIKIDELYTNEFNPFAEGGDK